MEIPKIRYARIDKGIYKVKVNNTAAAIVMYKKRAHLWECFGLNGKIGTGKHRHDAVINFLTNPIDIKSPG